jgi:hypothetical protein
MTSNAMPRWYLALVLAASAIALTPSGAAAQSDQVTQTGTPASRKGVRLGAPAGTYISNRLKDAELDDDRAATAEHEGRKIRLTPARATEDPEEAAQGHVIGVLETEVDGSETGLPAGRYTIFAKNVGGEWEAFAEVDGAVAKQALRVSATEVDSDVSKTMKPRFEASEGGWCWTTGPYHAPTAWARYDYRGYWHYTPTSWGRKQALTICW